MSMVAFSSLARFGARFDVHSMPVPFFLKSRSVRAHQSHVLGQDQSTVAEQAATTVAECFLMSCVQARYPDRFPHCACTAASSSNSDFVESRVYACSNITCHLHFWQNFFEKNLQYFSLRDRLFCMTPV